jgi:uncharacterized protein (TIGR02266 family)
VTDVAALFREFMRLDRKRAHPGLTTSELERWQLLKSRLGRTFSPELSRRRSDQRRSVRVPTRLEVRFRSDSELGASLMTNLSRGGLFLVTEHPAEIGTRLQLLIQLEGGGEEIEVSAEVVSQGVGPDLRADQRGMGLAFLDMPEESRRHIDELYERHFQRALKQAGGA